jgi:hypothetical protein
MKSTVIDTIKNNWILIAIIIFSVALFSPALNNFFSGDDWFHLKVVQISNFGEFLNFFNPVLNNQSIAFYRPISTQLFFYIFHQLFGLWAAPYYIFIFCIFVFNIVLYFKLLQRFNLSKTVVLISVFIFSFSHTQFTKLNFLSAGQELMMVTFFLLGLIHNQKNTQKIRHYFGTTIFYVLALLCKENAVVFPLIVIVFDLITIKKYVWKKVSLLAFISLLYLFVRFFVFDTTMTDIETYKLNFSPSLAINTVYFYVIWAVGGAELLQDYLATPIRLIDRYFTDFSFWGYLHIPLLILSVCSLFATTLLTIKKFSIKYLVPVALFIITLGPVLFLPQHKFTIQMTLPMMCFSVFVGFICENKPRWLVTTIVLFLLTLNLTSIYLTSKTHYSVQRSTISKKVYSYFYTNFPTYPTGSYFIFRNANTDGSTISTWGSSKQISYALWGSNFAKVFYDDPGVEVYYEDLSFTPPANQTPIYIDSKPLL